MIGSFVKIVALTTALLAAATTQAAAEHPLSNLAGRVPLASGTATVVNKCLNQKHLHLTYDDGPGALTNNLLDDLAAAGVKASFYVNGNNFQGRGAFTKRAFDEGHVIASHTWSHIQLTKATKNQIEEQMMRNHKAVQQMTGKHMAMMRPPYGATNDLVKEVLAGLDYTIVLWNVDTNDWRASNKREGAAADYVGAQARKGSMPIIALMHDIHKWSALSAPEMIRQVRAAGYTLVDLKTCLGMEPYHPDSFVPSHEFQPKQYKSCTAQSAVGINVRGTCMSSKECQHFEAGDIWRGKCPGLPGDIRCCTGGCVAECQKRFPSTDYDPSIASHCENACLASKAGWMDCVSRNKCAQCAETVEGSEAELACRYGYAFGFASAHSRTSCQRFCASGMYWENDSTGCTAECEKMLNGHLDFDVDCAKNCPYAEDPSTCATGCAYGLAMKVQAVKK